MRQCLISSTTFEYKPSYHKKTILKNCEERGKKQELVIIILISEATKKQTSKEVDEGLLFKQTHFWEGNTKQVRIRSC